MNAVSKITLSIEEQQLVSNTQWILTKRIIIEKIMLLFGDLSKAMEAHLSSKKKLPNPILISTPKISKGENYLGLPFVILDYPRYFEKENIFALRTMFWWGNFFSCTLQISGTYKTLFEQNVIKNIPNLNQLNFYLCINQSQWQHHFDENNYVALHTLTSQKIKRILYNQPHIKIAAKFNLQLWNNMPFLLHECFDNFLKILVD